MRRRLTLFPLRSTTHSPPRAILFDPSDVSRRRNRTCVHVSIANPVARRIESLPDQRTVSQVSVGYLSSVCGRIHHDGLIVEDVTWHDYACGVLHVLGSDEAESFREVLVFAKAALGIELRNPFCHCVLNGLEVALQ
jgi:hypothetical protein